ncbi:hypothetical protein DPMN_039859 [Dreissena polymorpha]|uniref:Uncharacterized protein n=1 Tax=Dreissena polymorpha TaxID=45954 RepID=A0A9D4HUF7_DREPO|nr:hypothetical protein DPMN_039859 [Dreissena polymorpha]
MMLETMEEHLRAAVWTERKVLSVLEEVRRIERRLDVKASAREQSSGRIQAASGGASMTAIIDRP